MLLRLDHKLFGNGFGLRSPHFDNAFYWLDGELYTFSAGLGAQLYSIQWLSPKPGERRTLCQREFVAFNTNRHWCRVMVSWALVGLPSDLDMALAAIQQLKADLGKI